MSTTPRRVYGIDLGTTYSAIAFVNEHGKAEIITNSDNDRVTPSVVFFEEDGNTIVGKIAKESAKTDPNRVVDFVKRQMSDKEWSFSVDGKTYKPEEISALILKRLAGDAKKTGEHDVVDVVITCPAYFGDLERQRTRQAGEIAGLNVIEILDEPVAAAINYGLNEDAKGKNVIVYDLGGGTFDVTVVSIGNDPDKNEISIVCTEGNHQLGGKDWDDRIVTHYAAEFQTQASSSTNLLEDQETAYDLRFNAETDKKTLSNKEKVTRKVSFEGDKAVVELPREKFDELTADLLGQTFALTDKVLEEAKTKGVTKIHAFLLVGGSTRMRQIKEKITERYGTTLGVTPVEFDVDEAVAKGAAKAGEIHILKGKIEEIAETVGGGDFNSLTDEQKKTVIEKVAEETGVEDYVLETTSKTEFKKVATKSYGIRALKGGQPIVRNLIIKQTPVPTEGSQIFGTAGPDADEIDLVVFMNNESEADAGIEVSEELGQAVFPLDGNLPAKAPIQITFKLDDQGSLTLVGLDQTHGKTITANFKSSGVMSAEEIKVAIEKSNELVVE
ncbi:MAG: Hsp70 family protein [Planctomycetaceae bacterium]|jgi:molecular chaperone DnaK (HSP70)|nr:Hsp70 family protein [Planctomycetaceae bacterium]